MVQKHTPLPEPEPRTPNPAAVGGNALGLRSVPKSMEHSKTERGRERERERERARERAIERERDGPLNVCGWFRLSLPFFVPLTSVAINLVMLTKSGRQSVR